MRNFTYQSQMMMLIVTAMSEMDEVCLINKIPLPMVTRRGEQRHISRNLC